jgi:hypothetical protein
MGTILIIVAIYLLGSAASFFRLLAFDYALEEKWISYKECNYTSIWDYFKQTSPASVAAVLLSWIGFIFITAVTTAFPIEGTKFYWFKFSFKDLNDLKK